MGRMPAQGSSDPEGAGGSLIYDVLIADLKAEITGLKIADQEIWTGAFSRLLDLS